jgi:multidrug efflux pump subunit AcrA (membrane-fusion protein)
VRTRQTKNRLVVTEAEPLRRLFIACAVALLSLTVAAAQDAPEKSKRTREVKGAAAATRVLRQTISASGVTMAAKHSRLNFQVPGVVDEILVEMGDRVRKGQKLATLDDSTYKLYVEQAQAGVKAAEATLSKLKAGFREEEVAQAKAAVDAARTSADQAQRDYERMKKLAEEKKAVADATLEQSKTRYELAKTQLEQASKALKLLQKGFQEEDVKAAAAQVDLARAQLKLAERKLEDAVLKAPYDAVVVRTYVDPGDSSGSGMPGQVAVEIMDITSLEVIVPVADVWSGSVTAKSRAILDLDGGPKKLEASVTAISDSIDLASRAFHVKLILDNSDLKLKAGMFARVRIVYKEMKALSVPTRAVLEDAEGTYVMVHKNGRAVKTRVKTGLGDDGYTEILKGLKEGDVVISEGSYGLADKARVKLTGDKSK